MNPAALDKYLYIRKTPTWEVRILYVFGILSWLAVTYAFSGSIFIDLFFTWFVAPIVAIFAVYNLTSFGLILLYKQFSIPNHFALMNRFWSQRSEPSVDVFLPICGEDVSVLRNTWRHVRNIRYTNRRVYILDDSKQGCEEHRKLAAEFGFVYIERPNKGEMKKAGNMKYAFERTYGEFIVILDADFAPHPDFIREALPYMDNQKVGIVQTPQYFETSPHIHKKSSVGIRRGTCAGGFLPGHSRFKG